MLGTPVGLVREPSTVFVLQNRAVFDDRFADRRRRLLRLLVSATARVNRVIAVAPGMGPSTMWVPIGFEPPSPPRTAPAATRQLVVPGSATDYRDFETVCELLERDERLRATFVGPGTDRRSFIATLRQRLGPRAVSMGQVSRAELIGLFERSFAVVLASHVEAYPVTALEAATSASRIVASDIAGHRLVLERFSGVEFYQAGSVGELGRALEACAPVDPRDRVEEWYKAESRITRVDMVSRYLELL